MLNNWIVLQSRLKEEITLNDTITKHQQSNLEDLKKHYHSYFTEQLQIKQSNDTSYKLSSLSTDDLENVRYYVVDNPETILNESLSPVSNLLFKMRRDFRIMSEILNYVKPMEYGEISDLLTSQFYENILVNNPEQDELLILCSFLIREEIEKMEVLNSKLFLSSSFLGRLLKNLSKKNEIKQFIFQLIETPITTMDTLQDNFMELEIGKIIEHIKKQKTNSNNSLFIEEKAKYLFRVSSASRFSDAKNSRLSHKKSMSSIKSAPGGKDEILFGNTSPFEEPSNNNKTLRMTMKSNFFNTSIGQSAIVEEDDNESKNSSNSDAGINDEQDEYNQEENFLSAIKYSLSVQDLKISLEKNCHDEPILAQFYKRHLKKAGENNFMYTNHRLNDLIRQHKNTADFDQILEIYENSFESLKRVINELLSNLIIKVDYMPYSLRCICKVISVCLRRKFPDIELIDLNLHISEFLFGKILLPILVSPDFSSILTSKILSTNTRKNLVNISKILKKIVRYEMFDSNLEYNYTSFNSYILENFSSINKFYSTLIEVPITATIENSIDCDSQSSHTINYFDIMKNQLIHLEAICFSMTDLLLITSIIARNISEFKNNPHLTTLVKSYDKLTFQEGYFKSLIKNDEKQKTKRHFIIYSPSYNPKCSYMFTTKNLVFTCSDFNERENAENKQFILQRVKYCINMILRQLNMINLKTFSFLQGTTQTAEFFASLNEVIMLEDQNLHIDKIPLTWYSIYLNSNLSKIDNDFSDNNFEKLYNQLLNEANNERDLIRIKTNSIITGLGLNIRCAEKKIESLKKDKYNVRHIERLIRVDKFIKVLEVDFCVKFSNPNQEHPWSVNMIEDCIHSKQKTQVNKQSNGTLQKISNMFKSSKDSSVKPIAPIPEHGKSLFDFVKILSSNKEIKYDIIEGTSKQQVHLAISGYLGLIYESVIKNKLFFNFSSEEIAESLESIEKTVIEKLYKW